MEDCHHPSFISDKCTLCGKSMNECGNPTTLPFRYIQPNLTLTLEEIHRRRDYNLQSLLSRKKLHLLLDLDLTLLHSTPIFYNMYNMSDKEVKHIKPVDGMYEILDGTYLVKLRPGAREFLEQLSSMYDISIYTRSYQDYAKEVVSLLDTQNENGPSSSRFSWVITREDCVRTNQKGLDIVLSHERVVLIVDDMKKVWKESGSENLIGIRPYYCFSKRKSKKMDEELVRVLNILKEVHGAFYDDNVECGEVDYWERDVRMMLQKVLLNQYRKKSNLIYRLLRLICIPFI